MELWRPSKTMIRTLRPELLDSLPPEHPDAQHSRRDLRLTNQIMGNHRWFARRLPSLVRDGELALEIGAGTGELARRLASHGVAADGLDVCPRPEAWPPARTWHVADLRTFEGYARYSVVFGNLIFHQFTDAELAELGATLRRTARVIVACEPARRRLSQALYATAASLLGASRITHHDAHVSIAAGFRQDELPRALGLDDGAWDIRCGTTALGAYRMVARSLA